MTPDQQNIPKGRLVEVQDDHRVVAWNRYSATRPRGDIDRMAAFDAGWSAARRFPSPPEVREVTEELIAHVLYDADPLYEGGEYVDGLPVSPGGFLRWDQMLEIEGSDLAVDQNLKKVRKSAKAVLRLLAPA